VAYEAASALKTWERVLNRFCTACLIEAKAEAEVALLVNMAKRRLEQAREKIATCPATAHMAELIDYAVRALNKDEYRKARADRTHHRLNFCHQTRGAHQM
jgi:hypothetical protein